MIRTDIWRPESRQAGRVKEFRERTSVICHAARGESLASRRVHLGVAYVQHSPGALKNFRHRDRSTWSAVCTTLGYANFRWNSSTSAPTSRTTASTPTATRCCARAAAAGVAQMVVTGASGTCSRKALELARAHPGVLFATAGVHPHHAADCTDGRCAELRELLAKPKWWRWANAGWTTSATSPRATCSAALSGGSWRSPRPAASRVFLHQRDAHADFVAILREYAAELAGGVVHCFTGRREELDAYSSWACTSASPAGSATSAAACTCASW